MFKLGYSKHTAIRELPNERDALMLLVHPQLLKGKAGLVLAAYTRTTDIATNLISCSLCSEERVSDGRSDVRLVQFPRRWLVR